MRSFKIGQFPPIESARDAGERMCLYPQLMAELMNDPSFRIWLREEDPIRSERAIQSFVSEKDPQVGLFKASYELAPAHGLVFMGEDFKTAENLGRRILQAAPRTDEAALNLFLSDGLAWYLKLIEFPKTAPNDWQALESRLNKEDSNPLVSYFRAGMILAHDKRFWFEGQPYDNISDFFEVKGGDRRIMSEYDFLTMPWCEAWHLENNMIKELGYSQSLAQANLKADDAFRKASKKK